MNVPGPEGLPNSSIPIRLTRVADHPDLAASLKRVALASRELVDGCDSASVTVLTQREAVTMAATDSVANALDQVQYDADDGPCLTAARGDQQVRVNDLAADDRWPSFRDAGQDLGLASSLSVPLPTTDAGVRGALNVYSGTVAGFSARDVRLVEESGTRPGWSWPTAPPSI